MDLDVYQAWLDAGKAKDAAFDAYQAACKAGKPLTEREHLLARYYAARNAVDDAYATYQASELARYRPGSMYNNYSGD